MIILPLCIWLVNRPKAYLAGFIFALDSVRRLHGAKDAVRSRTRARHRTARLFHAHPGFPFLPLVLGVVLGRLVESSYRRSLVAVGRRSRDFSRGSDRDRPFCSRRRLRRLLARSRVPRRARASSRRRGMKQRRQPWPAHGRSRRRLAAASPPTAASPAPGARTVCRACSSTSPASASPPATRTMSAPRSRAARRRAPCTAIGHERRLGPYDAALVNGTAAHGEDYDDTFEGGPVHAGAVIVPAVLAAAEHRGLDGAAIVPRDRGRHRDHVPDEPRSAAGDPQGRLPPDRRDRRAGRGGRGRRPRSACPPRRSPGRSASPAASPPASSNISPTAARRSASTPARRRRRAPRGAPRRGRLHRAGDGARRRARLLQGLRALEGAGFRAAARRPRVTVVARDVAFKPYACGTMTQPYIDCAIRAGRAGRGGRRHRRARVRGRRGNGSPPVGAARRSSSARRTAMPAKFSTPYCIAVGFLDGQGGPRAVHRRACRRP